MTLRSVVFPPSDQFWTQCARHLISSMEVGGDFAEAGANRLSALDFSGVRVIVPAFEHAQWLIRALEQELQSDFIVPRINTLAGWLALQPRGSVLQPVSDGERLMALYAQLREHVWLKKLFSARRNTDLLPLAQTLITLSDELTQAMLPSVLSNLAQQTWQEALAQLPVPAQRILSDEAQLVWSIWTSQLDGRDAISCHFEQLQDLAQSAPDPLLWINPVAPLHLELEFLTRYARHQPLTIIGLDWHKTGLDPQFCAAWPELEQTEADPLPAGCTSAHASANIAANTKSPAAASVWQRNGIALLPADSLEQEAQLGAQTIFDWLQQGKTSIALIAQDRVVARRIRALLQRANVFVADETGWKLSTTRAAAALAAWMDVVATRADTVVLLDLLKSPFLNPLMATTAVTTTATVSAQPQVSPSSLPSDKHSGQYAFQFDAPAWPSDAPGNHPVTESVTSEGSANSAVDEWADCVMVIEMALLRANVVGGWDSIEWALTSEPVCVGVVRQMKQLSSQFSGHKKLAEWLSVTRNTMQKLGMEAGLKQDVAGGQVLQLLSQLEDDCHQMNDLFSLAEWRAFLNLQLESAAFHEDKQDKRVLMLPLNGARLRRFDAVLMAGCDAAHLPSQPREVLFFTNAVRRECGLLTREQRQRQQLRDFTELLGSNPLVVLSWQSQQHGEHNPVSPWIARLNLSLQLNGVNHAGVNHADDNAATVIPAYSGMTRIPLHSVGLERKKLTAITVQQPRPVAPSLQPATLSASGFGSLLTCPYQFFATRMLGLSSLDVLSDMPEKRDYGDWLHAILKKYHDAVKSLSQRPSVTELEALLRQISQQEFAAILQKSPAALGYGIRWEKVIPAYIAWSQNFADSGWEYQQGEVWMEKKVEWNSENGGQSPNQVILRGQIDRLDINTERECAVLDYKTRGLSSLNKKLNESEDHQLAFYGLLAATGNQSITAAYYVALEAEREKTGAAQANDYPEWTSQLRHAIISSMRAIGQGQALPAQGTEAHCQYCEVRGLCRKGTW